MLILSCKDVGFDCNHVVKAGTEEEVIRNITEHVEHQCDYNRQKYFQYNVF